MKHIDVSEKTPAERRREYLERRRQLMIEAVVTAIGTAKNNGGQWGDFGDVHKLITEQRANLNDLQFGLADAQFDQVRFAAGYSAWLDAKAGQVRAREADRIEAMILQSSLFDEVAF